MSHKKYTKRANKFKSKNKNRFRDRYNKDSRTCYICGDDFKPNEGGHYECKSVREVSNG